MEDKQPNLTCDGCGEIIWNTPLYIGEHIYCGRCEPVKVISRYNREFIDRLEKKENKN